MILGSPLAELFPHHTESQEQYRNLIAKLITLRQESRPQADDPALRKHLERKKLYVRDRINLLLDAGSFFLELSEFAGAGVYDGIRPGAGIVTGIGQVSGHPVMIIANDATLKGGTYFPLTVKKHLRAQAIANNLKLPCISLVDSGGAFLPLQSEIFPDEQHFGRIFFNQARMSSQGIAQIAAVMGSCTAGGAYVPAMCDQTIIVEGTGSIYLAGPALVQAATGEVVSSEELGGARVHCEKSGVADYLAKNDEHAIEILRELCAELPMPGRPRQPDRLPRNPLFDSSEIPSLIPKDTRHYFPIREILARLLDGSEFVEFKSEYGKTLLCGNAYIGGYQVGIIANDGVLFSESAEKGAHFIQICNQRNIPLVFVQNIAGFMVGKEYEQGGIAKDGAKMVNAVACAQVPKYTLIVGGSFGAGNYGMCGRAYEPRFLWTWPNAQTAIMGAEQAVSVLTAVKAESLKTQKKDWKDDERQKFQKESRRTFLEQSQALYGSARIWDDGILLPEQTRATLQLALALEDCCPQPMQGSYGVMRM